MEYPKIIAEVKKTIESGYYQRFAPTKKEKRSLVEEIEKSFIEGKIPLIAEVLACDEKRLCFSTKNKVLQYLNILDTEKKINAIDIWVEPRKFSGDLRWLQKNFKKIIIASDYIIDPVQMVGGDAIVLDYGLIEAAKVDLHKLIDYAHEEDFETILKVKENKEFEEAKKTETDIIMIENEHGMDSKNTLKILNKNKTTRPIIAKNGVNRPEDIRKMIIAGIKGFELGYQYSTSQTKIKEKIKEVEQSIKGTENYRYQNIVVVK
ncbi:MAG: hypothetical protein ACK4J0_00300 [Candidatus Anstonellaceae archaeon]